MGAATDGGIIAADVFVVAGELGYLGAIGGTAVTGPIGAAAACLFFAAKEIYVTRKAVNQIDDEIHLSGFEYFEESAHYFLKGHPFLKTELLVEGKKLNNELVTEAVEKLSNNTMGSIKYYFFNSANVTSELGFVQCDWSDYVSIFLTAIEQDNPKQNIVVYCVYDKNGNSHTQQKIFDAHYKKATIFMQSLATNITIDLRQMIDNANVSRIRPDSKDDNQIICYPSGNYEMMNEPSYYCDGAIGVSGNETGENVLFALHEGFSEVYGLESAKNIFLFRAGNKRLVGGSLDDLFKFVKTENSSYAVEGMTIEIDGLDGTNAVDLRDFDSSNLNNIFMKNIQVIFGAKKSESRLNVVCGTQFITAGGGIVTSESIGYEEITVAKNSNCSHNLSIALNAYTKVFNNGENGTFKYFIQDEIGINEIFFFEKANNSHVIAFQKFSIFDITLLIHNKEYFEISLRKYDAYDGTNLRLHNFVNKQVMCIFLDAEIFLGKSYLFGKVAHKNGTLETLYTKI